MSSTLTRAAYVTGAVVVTAGLALGGALAPVEHTASQAVEVKVGAQSVCPNIPARAGKTAALVATLTDGVETDPLGGGTLQKLRKATTTVVSADGGPQRISVAPGGHAAGVSVNAETSGVYAGLGIARCVQATTSAWFVGVPSDRERVSEVVLANADEIPAEVDLTLYGPDGRLTVKTGHSIIVPPGETTTVALEGMFTSPDPVTVQVSSPQGRVVAFVRERGLATSGATQGKGFDWHAPSVAPRKEIIIPAALPGAGARDLQIVNPGEKRAQVKVELMAPDGPHQLSELSSISVRPKASTSLNLGTQLGEKPAALRITGNVEITASLGWTDGVTGGDFTTSPAVPTFDGEALLPVLQQGQTSVVHIANPGEAGTATVSFLDAAGKPIGQSMAVSVPTSGTAVVAVQGRGAVAVVVKTESPMAAALVAQRQLGALKGTAVVPFEASAAESRFANPVADSRVGR